MTTETISLRDHFAGMAIGTVLTILNDASASNFASMAEKRGLDVKRGAMPALAAAMSYEIADAMLEARK